jgi:hypothetical protein
MVTYLAGNRIRGLNSERVSSPAQTTSWQNVSFDSSTEVNGITSSGNKAVGTGVTGNWASYMRSNEFIDTSTGGGEFYFTNIPITNYTGGFEKSPYNQYPSGTYQNGNYSYHITTATNNIYEKTTNYSGTANTGSLTQEFKIAITSGGTVTYQARANSSGSWTTDRTTTGASGKFYINTGFQSNQASGAAQPTFYIKGNVVTTNLLPNVEDGSIFYETDTNKSYVLNSGTWTEL